jgi:hypothetical protein
MNDAIFKFKRYEDSSLSYTGIDKHQGEDIGGWDTVIRREEYEKLFFNQQATMDAPEREEFVEEIEEEPVVPTPIVHKVESKSVNKSSPELVTKAYGIVTPKAQTPTKPTTTVTQLPKPEVPVVDTSKLVVGAIVKHKVFGEGEIVKVDKTITHINVKFKVGEKTFVIGGVNCAFKNGFLKI